MPTKRNEVGTFALSKLSDSAPAVLQQDVNEEIMRREAAKQKRRQDWVSRMVEEFHSHCGTYTRIDDTVVVIVKRGGSVKVGKTTPTKNDKFNLEVGVAVAFAKAVGATIPDYI